MVQKKLRPSGALLRGGQITPELTLGVNKIGSPPGLFERHYMHSVSLRVDLGEEAMGYGAEGGEGVGLGAEGL